GDRTITLTVTTSPGSPATASMTIFDDEMPIVSVAKIADADETGTGGTFRFTRSGPTGSALTVTYSVGGTASAGSDYTSLSGSIAFSSSSNTADMTVTPRADNLV